MMRLGRPRDLGRTHMAMIKASTRSPARPEGGSQSRIVPCNQVGSFMPRPFVVDEMPAYFVQGYEIPSVL